MSDTPLSDACEDAGALYDLCQRLERERNAFATAISEANWLLSGHVDAGGGTKALLEWAKQAKEWNAVSCHRDQRDRLAAALDRVRAGLQPFAAVRDGTPLYLIPNLPDCHLSVTLPAPVWQEAKDAWEATS